MACKSRTRNLPRRELPWIGPLLNKMPFSKFPTNHVVLQRVLFEIENHHGAASVAQASLDVRNEVIAVWEYAGYGDILQAKSNILKKVKELHINCKSLTQVPISRREGAYMVPERGAYPLQQEHNSRGTHNSCQEDRIPTSS